MFAFMCVYVCISVHNMCDHDDMYFSVLQAQILKECGADNKCIPDLVLKSFRYSFCLPLHWPSGKASASRAADLGSIPVFAMDLFPS